MSSKKPSDASRPLDWRIPTTAADVIALRRAREKRRPWPLDALNLLAPPPLFPARTIRRIPDGAEPFRL